MSFQNLMIKVQMPAGLKLADGSQLQKDVTFEVLSPLSPFYSSPDMVRMEGGMFLTKISDLTMATQVYWQSRNADAINFGGEPDPPPAGDHSSQSFIAYRFWVNARQRFVTYKSAMTLIVNVIDLMGKRGGKTLGNFSSEYRDMRSGDSGLTSKLSQLSKQIEDLTPVIESGGRIGPGGTNLSRIAAPMARNFNEPTPGRLWAVTGIGANSTSERYIRSDGSQSPPVKYMSSPYTFWYFSASTRLLGLIETWK